MFQWLLSTLKIKFWTPFPDTKGPVYLSSVHWSHAFQLLLMPVTFPQCSCPVWPLALNPIRCLLSPKAVLDPPSTDIAPAGCSLKAWFFSVGTQILFVMMLAWLSICLLGLQAPGIRDCVFPGKMALVTRSDCPISGVQYTGLMGIQGWLLLLSFPWVSGFERF